MDGGPVGDGGSGARYITDTDGARWVLKGTIFGGQAHRYLYANEAVTAQIGHRMGLRVPEIAIVELSDEQLAGFNAAAPSSARFLIGSQLIDPAEPLTPDSAAGSSRVERAGIVTLDSLVWNTDRKPEHVLAEAVGGDWRLWPIDHGHTFAVADTLSGNLDPTRLANPPLELLASGLEAADINHWADQIEAIKRSEFHEIVRALPAAWVVEPDAPDLLADALFARAKLVRAELSAHL